MSRHWFGVVESGDFAHYLAGTRVERLRTIKGAFAYAGKRYMAKKEEMPVMEQKPGRYWGVIGREHLPLGKREDREVSASQAVKLRRVMRRYRLANTPPEKRKFLRKSQLWSEDFTAKLFCNVEFWLERLPQFTERRRERLPKLTGPSENLSKGSWTARPGGRQFDQSAGLPA